MKRRSFFKRIILGLTGVALAPSALIKAKARLPIRVGMPLSTVLEKIYAGEKFYLNGSKNPITAIEIKDMMIKYNLK